jgi:hypothetical protein
MNARRKKTYLLLLGLGATALVVDRGFLARPVSAPESASAEESPAAQASSEAPAPFGESGGIPELPFPADLARFSPSLLVPDLFTDPTNTSDSQRAAQADNDDAKTQSGAPSAQIADMLQGVFVHADVQYAIVNGRKLKRGENINGCTLTEVSGTRVRFLCADREVIATVPTSSSGGPR